MPITEEKSLYTTTRVVWYIFTALETLLLFRFVLKLLGANPGAGFTQLIYGLTALPLAPFQFVFGNNAIGDKVFEWSTLLAMIVYWILAWGIIRLIVMNRPVSHFEAHTGVREQDAV